MAILSAQWVHVAGQREDSYAGQPGSSLSSPCNSWQIAIGRKKKKSNLGLLKCLHAFELHRFTWKNPPVKKWSPRLSKVKKVPTDFFSSGKGRNRWEGNTKRWLGLFLRSWKYKHVQLFYCNKKYQYFLNLFPNYASLCVSGQFSATICCCEGSTAVQRCSLITGHSCVTIYKLINQTGNCSLRKRPSFS